MLEIKNITKVYDTGSFKQVALDNINIKFRKSEFVSILGPSGSGKTTLLNIIGGLDKYTKGDLIINNISTKKYKDSDWDSYRNNRVGFIFQNYNLIMHQTVLQNVELALTLSGYSKKEATKLSIDALKKVGLEDHIYKKPNELSGGQMQRVAIARSLVNNPDIILADEPTGALDSNTSVQIMELLKKISKEKLVIMVTHNPELAKKYSSRIVNLIDGHIVSDSKPVLKEKESKTIFENTKKTFMSFKTALGLSFNNLMTKKKRTVLVSFAGSIGIIGIALIMSLSNGFQNYIDKLQEDTLSSYPLTITNENADMTSLLLSMVSDDEDNDRENVIEKQYLQNMFSNISSNDLKSFKNYLDTNKNVNKYVTSIKYSYSVDPVIYTKREGTLQKVNPNTIFSSIYGSSSMSSMFSSYSSIFNQISDDIDALNENYNVLAGSWPNNYDEMVIVLSEEHSISDLLLYFLGLKDMDELYEIVSKSMSGEEYTSTSEPLEFTYEELMNIDFRLINSYELYKYNDKYNIYEDMSEDEDYINDLYNNALKLKIVGIVCPKEGNTSMALSSGVGYTSDLIKYIINNAKDSDIVKKQLENEEIDVISNTRFDSNETQTLDLEDLISIDTDSLKNAFGMNIDENTIKNIASKYMQEINESINIDNIKAKEDLDDVLSYTIKGIFTSYMSNPLHTKTDELTSITYNLIYEQDVDDIVNDYLASTEVQNKLSKLEKTYVIPSSTYNEILKTLLTTILNTYITSYYSIDSSLTTDENNKCAILIEDTINTITDSFISSSQIDDLSNTLSKQMTEALIKQTVLTKVGELTTKLMETISSSFKVDQNKIASAFKINLNEDELKRIISSMYSTDDTSNAYSNLIKFGYQDLEEPTMISIYFKDFDSKEEFLNIIDEYNDSVEEEKQINYTDTTGILMSSVKKIVNSVSYVLIAFVSISLIVSSIMIGIITYISVLERTKEIGVLRAIGASKKNISSIFNAETFIIGLLSGVLGISITLILNPIINIVIHNLTSNYNINATIPLISCIILVILSIILTLIGGIIPSMKASKCDPVVALRSE